MASGVGQTELRVILLGRTGLDAALRLDPAIELIRVKTPLEAIGELANPIDDASPTRAAVIVAPRVEGLIDDDTSGARAREFVEAIRVAHPGAVVFGVQNGEAAPGAFDAGLRADAAPEALRRAVRWRPGMSERFEGVVPVPTPSGRLAEGVRPQPAPAELTPESAILDPILATAHPAEAAGEVRSAPSTAPSGPREPGDLALINMLLRGQDLLPAAVGMIRERTGDATIEFVGVSDGGPRDSRAVTVQWEAACFGDLRSSRSPAGVLTAHARWLAGWLRLRDQQSQLRIAAFTDPLTGAWNRRYFDRFISTAIEQARNGRRHLTVMLFDIDNFKHYNDLYGHDAGDDILREAVRLLRSVIRPTDRVCRVGGDEFAVIFHEPEGPRQTGSQHPSDVLAIAGRFQQQVLAHRFPKLLDCAPGTLTISGGLATFPWDGSSPAELLARADQLAMQSKKQGKNAITLGPGAMRLMEG